MRSAARAGDRGRAARHLVVQPAHRRDLVFGPRRRRLFGLDDNLDRPTRATLQGARPSRRLGAAGRALITPLPRRAAGGRISDRPARTARPAGSMRWAPPRATRTAPPPRSTASISTSPSASSAEEELDETRRQLELAVEGAKLGTGRSTRRAATAWYSDRSREHSRTRAATLPLDAKIAEDPTSIPTIGTSVLESYPQGLPGRRDLESSIGWSGPTATCAGSIRSAPRSATKAARVRMVSGIHLDITDRKQAEEELARSRDALTSREARRLGALLAGVSHELNNPLAAIVGQAEMLQEDSARHGVRGAGAQDRRGGRALRADRPDLPRHGPAARAAGAASST